MKKFFLILPVIAILGGCSSVYHNDSNKHYPVASIMGQTVYYMNADRQWVSGVVTDEFFFKQANMKKHEWADHMVIIDGKIIQYADNVCHREPFGKQLND